MTKQSLSTIVFFFLLVSISSTQMEAEIDSRAFQEIMDDFVEVHRAAGQNVDLGLVLSDVKITLQASERKYHEFLTSFMLSCNNAKGKVDGFVKSLTNAKLEAQNQITNYWANQLAKGRKGINEAQTNTKQINQRIAQIQQQMTDIVLKYQRGVAETDNKLHVVKQLRDIIEDELINPGKSFIQVKKFHNKLNDLKELIEKSGDTLYTPIIQTLVELASEQNFSDQKILRAILNNLKALETNLLNFKGERETAMNVNLKNLRAQEDNLNAQLNDYSHLEQRYTSDVREAEQNTEILQAEVTNLASEITRKQDELQNIVHLCDTENEMFKSGSKRMELIRGDLNLAVNRAMDLLK